jgi:hypothetical protein
VDEVIDGLHETYAGRSSLREAWLTWSNRESRISVERLDEQLRVMGFQIDNSAAEEIMRRIGGDDASQGLSYNGFLRLVVGDHASK